MSLCPACRCAVVFRLSSAPARALARLLDGAVHDQDDLRAAMPCHGSSSNAVSMQIKRARVAIERFGFTIRNHPSRGYSISAEHCAAIRVMLEEAN